MYSLAPSPLRRCLSSRQSLKTCQLVLLQLTFKLIKRTALLMLIAVLHLDPVRQLNAGLGALSEKRLLLAGLELNRYEYFHYGAYHVYEYTNM
jgi:hypothetical protein